MLEHVGDKFMIQYFESISSPLNRENGIMVVQGIAIINSVSTSQASIFSRLVLLLPSLS
jgi:cyclopropane fatty-acyl-phospholipid synthase-like methyltransferase